MYLINVYEGKAKATGREFVSLTLLDDTGRSKQVFATPELMSSGIDKELISNPKNGWVNVEISVDPFTGNVKSVDMV